MKSLPTLLLLALPALAAVSGTVVNRTTGQPAAGVTVVLNSMGTNGFEPAAETKSDAQGRFTIDHEVQGPRMVRITFEGVSYFQVLPPGSPSTDLALDVYNSSKQPGAAKVSKHLLAFTPTAQGDLTIQETYLFTNDGKTAWNDPQGELRFYLPPAARGKVEVNATAPGGMAVPASLVKTSSPDILAVDFAIKPGETSFDVTYSVPYTAGAPYEGKVVTKDDNTYLIAPQGVTLVGEGLQDLGTYPRTQAHIFGLPGNTYRIAMTGVAVAPAEPEAAAPDEQQDNGQKISAILPRIYGNIKLILGLALAILAVGFTLLYRKSSDLSAPAKEPNGRGRR
jgi:5-hydroxyisourate hydrolase-like protein (transthyretin family)